MRQRTRSSAFTLIELLVVDRHHRRADRPAAAGGAEGPRAAPRSGVPDQPAADRLGGASSITTPPTASSSCTIPSTPT